jgi:hypothetical protein
MKPNQAVEAPQEESSAEIACTLPADRLADRTKEVVMMFEGSEETRELPDGYAFRFPGTRDWVTKLVEFVLFERHCCAFFRFELVFEANEGAVWLRLRGAEGVKELIRARLDGKV